MLVSLTITSAIKSPTSLNVNVQCSVNIEQCGYCIFNCLSYHETILPKFLDFLLHHDACIFIYHITILSCQSLQISYHLTILSCRSLQIFDHITILSCKRLVHFRSHHASILSKLVDRVDIYLFHNIKQINLFIVIYLFLLIVIDL